MWASRSLATDRASLVTLYRRPVLRLGHAELHFPRRRAYAMGMPATTDLYWLPADLEQFPEDDGCKYECIDGVLLVTPAPGMVDAAAVGAVRFQVDSFV